MQEIAENATPRKQSKAAARGKKAVKMPAFQKPQLATLVDHVPTGNQWLHELKYDGYRCLLAKSADQIRAYTRSGLDWSEKFSEIVASAPALDVVSALLYGDRKSVVEGTSVSV